MSPRRRNQQGSLGRKLPLNFIQVWVGFAGVEQTVGGVGFDGRVAIEMRDRLKQMIHRNHLQPRRQACLLGIRSRDYQHTPGLACRQRRRQHPANRPHRT
ncbi:hypothetical protein D3C86_1676960 [compost metagenome]